MAIMQWVSFQKKICDDIIHIPNEGARNPSFGAKLKKLGMKRGVPDLFIAVPSNGFHGAWIEVKQPKGKLTKEQEIFLDRANKNGYFTAVVYSVDEGINAISWYMNIAKE